MAKKINKIDLFEEKMKVTKIRNLTFKEMEEKSKNSDFSGIQDSFVEETIEEVSNNSELAKAIAKNNNMEAIVNNTLEKNKTYKKAQCFKTPKSTLEYQKTNNRKLCDKVNEEIKKHGVILSEGQELFHGGLPNTKVGDVIKTNEILSTTLNPHVAIANGIHNEKAYNDNELNLNCIVLNDDNIHGIVCNNRSIRKNEKEVILEKDIQYEVVSKTHLCNITVENLNLDTKSVSLNFVQLQAKKSSAVI